MVKNIGGAVVVFPQKKWNVLLTLLRNKWVLYSFTSDEVNNLKIHCMRTRNKLPKYYHPPIKQNVYFFINKIKGRSDFKKSFWENEHTFPYFISDYFS